MTNDPQVKQETGDWPTVKSLTREWLTVNGIALTGTNGEVSRSTVNRFKLALQRVIVDLLATVRKEEREAAFKVQCADCAEGSTPTFDQDARWYYHGLGHTEVGCSASKLRIAALEASANQKEGMNG